MLITFKNRCPRCNGLSRKRLQRSPWMRLVIGTRLYQCMSCKAVYLNIFIKNPFKKKTN